MFKNALSLAALLLRFSKQYKISMKLLLFVLAISPTFLFAQSRKERKALEAQQRADLVVINNLKSHIQNLTNTETTQSGVEDYVSSQFRVLGLKPKSDNSYIQAYSV